MNAVTLNADKSVVTVEPGNNWLAVYSALEPYGLAAIGGRASSIGVGGFVLGGGISYHSNLYGWALDNVQSFEVSLCQWSANLHRTLGAHKFLGRHCYGYYRHCK